MNNLQPTTKRGKRMLVKTVELLDWEDLVAIEPGLDQLLTEIRRLKDPGGPYFCAEKLWHGCYKSRLAFLAGFHARNPRLRSMRCYDIGFEVVYGAMPQCRGCACIA